MITVRLTDSLTPVFPGRFDGPTLSSFSLCRNEPFSFQMAYRITEGPEKSVPFFVRVETELPLSCYYVGCVPVIHTDFPPLEPTPPVGPYPDVLMPKAVNPPLTRVETWGEVRYYESGEKTALFAYNDSWQALWFTVNENGAELPAGTYGVRMELFSRKREKVGEASLSLEVLDAVLPPQTLLYTNWFHCDCLADWYHTEIFSDRFFEIMRDFVRKAARNGMNMILLPAFTPPLDTPAGMERMTAQLVRVTVEDGAYRFDFSLLERFIDLCREEGIGYFEHSHFFTQWGAAHAPKILADTGSGEVRLFGWDTDALSDGYVGFLRSYLTALRGFLREKGLEKNVLFHVSDEPNASNFRAYEAAFAKIADLLEGYMVGDALSDVRFFESGLVKLPIASAPHAADFVGRGGDIWVYYTGADVGNGMSNRILTISRERNRSLGVQLYKSGAKGFLHWGYNYYYGELSFGLADPFLTPTGGYPNPATSYCVYPAPDGTAYQSVRQKIFAEGLVDMRALQLLESLSGRPVCEAVIENYFGACDFYSSAASPGVLTAFRTEVNDAIRRYAAGKK